MSWSWLGLFAAGLGTFLSPCVFPLVPILVASWATTDLERGSRWSRVRSTAWFAVGFTLAFVALGSGFGALSSALGSMKPALFLIASVILAIFGLRMTGVIRGDGMLSWVHRSFRLPDFTGKLPRGLNGVVFGLIFGLGWTPCVGPVLGAVLTYVASKQGSPARGATMLLVFSLGISLPLLGVAFGLERVTPWLARMRRWIPKIEYAMGVGLLIFASMLLMQARFAGTAALSSANPASPVVAMDVQNETLTLGRAKPGQTRMVFFFSEHCPVCHAMERYLPDFEKSCASKAFRFSRVDVDQAENSSAAERFNIRAVPVVSVFDDQGREVLHLVGYQTEARLRDAARAFGGLLCRSAATGKESMPEFNPDQACRLGEHC